MFQLFFAATMKKTHAQHSMALFPVEVLPPVAVDAIRKLRNEHLNIWKKRVKVGDPIFIRIQTSGTFVEGVVEELDFAKCLVGVRTPSGVVFVGLTDVNYVQILCKKPGQEIKESKPPKLNPKEDVCANKSLLWTKANVHDAVRVQLANEAGSFEAVVVEINWKLGFVGLSTPSGVTYVPIDSFTAVEKLGAKKPLKKESSSSSSKKISPK